jgi:hypothetical protein
MIKLIKVGTPEGATVQFNGAHVTHIRPVGDNVTEVTFVHGEKIRVALRDDELAARITR